jgi:hypothetical protein
MPLGFLETLVYDKVRARVTTLLRKAAVAAHLVVLFVCVLYLPRIMEGASSFDEARQMCLENPCILAFDNTFSEVGIVANFTGGLAGGNAPAKVRSLGEVKGGCRRESFCSLAMPPGNSLETWTNQDGTVKEVCRDRFCDAVEREGLPKDPRMLQVVQTLKEIFFQDHNDGNRKAYGGRVEKAYAPGEIYGGRGLSVL